MELFDNKLSNNKLCDNNLASELVENRSFLNQSQSRKLYVLSLRVVIMTHKNLTAGNCFKPP